MLYLKYENDTFLKLVSRLKFGDFQPRFDSRIFGINPRFRCIPTQLFHHNQHLLVFEPNTGSWCFLEPEEYEIFKSLDERCLVEFLVDFPEESWERLKEFVVRLYWLGLVKIDDIPFFEPDLYAKGPITVKGPLLLIVPTERCNLSCLYCFAESDPSQTKQMNWTTAKRIIDLSANFPAQFLTFEFAGGEPFLEADLITRIITYAWQQILENEKMFRFTAQTNGTLLSRGLIQLVKKLGLSLGISLDGDQAHNDRTRVFPDGSGTYSVIAQSVRMMLEQNMNPGMICTITKSNIHSVGESIENFKSFGLRSVKFNPVFKLGRADRESFSLGLSPLEFLEMHKEYLDYVNRTEDPLIESNTRYLLLNMTSKMHHYRCMRSQCGAGSDFFTFTPEGNIYPCSRYRSNKDYCLGNVHTVNNLDDLWRKNPIIVEIKERHVNNIEKCKNCLYKIFCQAGCPLDSHSFYGTATDPHPWCDYYQGIYDELFRQVGNNPEMAKKLCPDITIYQESFSNCQPSASGLSG